MNSQKPKSIIQLIKNIFLIGILSLTTAMLCIGLVYTYGRYQAEDVDVQFYEIEIGDAKKEIKKSFLNEFVKSEKALHPDYYQVKPDYCFHLKLNSLYKPIVWEIAFKNEIVIGKHIYQ